MSSLFINVLRQAFKTFDRANNGMFTANFTLLKQLTDQLTFRDIQLNPQLFNDLFERPDKAPCTFVQIYENADVSMSVFIMRAGYTMPLHDHPMMHGILRGIAGTLQVLSYTQQLHSNEPLIYDKMTRQVNVVAEEAKLVSADTECAVLTPRERNFHEITAIDGVAAFFDILSPPYDTEIPGNGTLKCRFYQRAAANQTLLYDGSHISAGTALRLLRIPAPQSYYCDTLEPPEALAECAFICSAEAYSS